MRKILIAACLIFLSISGFSQEKTLYFSQAISANIEKYEQKANKAYRQNNVERANFLFDSLIDHCLKGSYLDNFRVHNLKKNDTFLEDFEKPVFLRTYASWLVPTEGEVPALNELAKEYNNEIQIVVLFWDKHETTKELAKKYHKNIKVLYVDELQNDSSGVIRTMKHSLGFPTTFLLNRNKKIVDIRRSLSHPYGIGKEQSFKLNYDSIADGISLLLLNDSNQLNPNEGFAKLP